MEAKFYKGIDDGKLKFAVIVSKYQEQWIYCKHRECYFLRNRKVYEQRIYLECNSELMAA